MRYSSTTVLNVLFWISDSQSLPAFDSKLVGSHPCETMMHDRCSTFPNFELEEGDHFDKLPFPVWFGIDLDGLQPRKGQLNKDTTH